MSDCKILRRRLQDEFQQVYWVNPEEYPQLKFRSVAKLAAQRLVQLHKGVFLDCNCVAVKNIDELFHHNGVQFVGKKAGQGEEFAAVLVKARSLSEKEREIATDLTVEKENRE